MGYLKLFWGVLKFCKSETSLLSRMPDFYTKPLAGEIFQRFCDYLKYVIFPIYCTLRILPKTFSIGWLVNSYANWVRNNFIELLNTYELKLGCKDGLQVISCNLCILQSRISSYRKDPSFLEKLQVFVRTLHFSWPESCFKDKFDKYIMELLTQKVIHGCTLQTRIYVCFKDPHFLAILQASTKI